VNKRDVETLRWAWELTWRQSTTQDVEMRERLRVMIPEKDRPPEETIR